MCNSENFPPCLVEQEVGIIILKYSLALFNKVKKFTLSDPEILPLSRYPSDILPHVYQKICTRNFVKKEKENSNMFIRSRMD